MRLASEFKANCEVISLSKDNLNSVQLLKEQDSAAKAHYAAIKFDEI